MTDLVAWMRRQLDEDEAWARAATRPYEYADEGTTAPAGGVHWVWVTGENWDPVQPDPAVTELVEGPDGSWEANLATVETWPSTARLDDGTVIHTQMMPRVYAHSITEMDSAAAGHIARHDPARVLAEVAAKRGIVEDCESVLTGRTSDDSKDLARDVLHALALPYADRPGWRKEWRP